MTAKRYGQKNSISLEEVIKFIDQMKRRGVTVVTIIPFPIRRASSNESEKAHNVR